MSKLQGHIVVGIFDIAAIAILYWLYISHINLTNALAHQSDVISFNNRTYILGGAVLFPMFHIMAVVEGLKPELFTKPVKTALNVVILAALAFFLILPFAVSHSIEGKLIERGYHFCDEASFHGTVSSTLVYVKTQQLCSKDLEKE